MTEEEVLHIGKKLNDNRKSIDRKDKLLRDIRKFMNRLPSEWYPEYLVALLDKEIEG